MTPAKILLVDIETAPMLAFVWQKSLYNTNIRIDQVERDTSILSFAAKWLGEKRMIYEDQSRAPDMFDDTKLLKSIWKLLDEAEIVIAHNGKAFDIPFIQARMIAKNLPPPSPFKQIDTLKEVKQFGFTYNSLEHIAEECGCPKSDHREFPGISLWRECLRGNKRAWRAMKEYNTQDVKALEVVYLRLRAWIDRHPNMGMWIDDGEKHCPKCGSSKLIIRGHRVTNTGRYNMYHCLSCRGYSRGRDLQNNGTHRKNQLSN
jgi:hypothetical protein